MKVNLDVPLVGVNVRWLRQLSFCRRCGDNETCKGAWSKSKHRERDMIVMARRATCIPS